MSPPVQRERRQRAKVLVWKNTVVACLVALAGHFKNKKKRKRDVL